MSLNRGLFGRAFALSIGILAIYFLPQQCQASIRLDPSVAFNRAQAVLRHFEVPVEGDSQAQFQSLQGVASIQALRAALPFLDRNGAFSSYSTLISKPDGTTELQVFQDPRAKKVLDYSVRLAALPWVVQPRFLQNLQRASTQVGARPLKGLRIALDPGHMGGDRWDLESGKYVKDANGHQLSEGVLTLQIALLLEEQLRAAGAETFLTRRHLGPITELPYESFALRPFALSQFRESVSEKWFQSLIENHEIGQKLYSSFLDQSEFQEIFSESRRSHYFISAADLNIRSQLMQDFHPDISLVIHLDTFDPPGNPTGINPLGYDGTKAYVLGGFFGDEFASREARRFFGMHLLDRTAWNASVHLGRALVSQIRDRLGVRLDPSDGGNSVRVEPGVLARNLNVQRKLTGHATSYIECLYYNDPHEFEALSDTRFPLLIDGVNYPYSTRLSQLVEALGAGIIQFVREYSGEHSE